MPLRVVIVDFGGVLVRTEDQAPRRALAARLGVDERDLYRRVFDCEPAIQATLGAVPARAVWEYIGHDLGLPADQVAQFRRDFFAGDRLDTSLVELLKSLRPRYLTAILSNAWSDGRANFTRLFGLDQAVDAIIVSAEEGLAKPDPRLYRRAAERLGIQPAEAVFVDDVLANVDAARAVGMHAIHFTPGTDLRADLARLGITGPDGPRG